MSTFLLLSFSQLLQDLHGEILDSAGCAPRCITNERCNVLEGDEKGLTERRWLGGDPWCRAWIGRGMLVLQKCQVILLVVKDLVITHNAPVSRSLLVP